MKTTAESACIIGKREEIKSLPARVAMIVVFMAHGTFPYYHDAL